MFQKQYKYEKKKKKRVQILRKKRAKFQTKAQKRSKALAISAVTRRVGTYDVGSTPWGYVKILTSYSRAKSALLSMSTLASSSNPFFCPTISSNFVANNLQGWHHLKKETKFMYFSIYYKNNTKKQTGNYECALSLGIQWNKYNIKATKKE